MTTKHTLCPHCASRPRVSTFAPDRVELERERGERFQVDCPYCGETFTTHVNKVVATPNHLPTKIVWAICISIWVVVFITGAWANIFVLILLGGTFGLPVAAHKAVEKSARVFNDYQITETSAL